MQEKISIIIPVYKTEKYLKKCLDSILKQTYKNLEIILVDDGSPDSSGKICDEYAQKDKRIVVVHQKNFGVSYARNVGLNIATGEYVAFVDSDDWIDSNMYEVMLSQIKKNNFDIVRCSYLKEYESETQKVDHFYKENTEINLGEVRKNILKLLVTGKIHAYLPLLLIRKAIILDEMRFNSFVSMREDLIWLIAVLAKAKNISILTDTMYHYYQNENSATNSKRNREKNIKDMIIVYEEIYKTLEENKLLDIYLNETLAFSIFFRISSEVSVWIKETKDKALLLFLQESESFKKIIKNVNSKDLSIINKIFIFLYNKEKTDLLFHYCLLREYVRKVIR